MRIISGRLRGKRLEWVSDSTTRPTTDRVKENIFNVLVSSGVDIPSAKVLVLFAGSGQMVLECFSRGSTSIVLNDTSKTAIGIIKKNCASANLSPNIIGLDYMDALGKLKPQKFDLVFLDPPFALPDAADNAVKYLLENDMLAPSAIIVIESESNQTQAPDFDGFSVHVKTYGRETIYFLSVI